MYVIVVEFDVFNNNVVKYDAMYAIVVKSDVGENFVVKSGAKYELSSNLTHHLKCRLFRCFVRNSRQIRRIMCNCREI